MNINLNTKNEIAAIIASALVVETTDPEIFAPREVPTTEIPASVQSHFNAHIEAALSNAGFSEAMNEVGFERFLNLEVSGGYFLILRTQCFDFIVAHKGALYFENIKAMTGKGRAIAMLRDKRSLVLESYGFKAETLMGDPIYIWRP